MKIGEYYEVITEEGLTLWMKTTEGRTLYLGKYDAVECSVISGGNWPIWALPLIETNNKEILKDFAIKSYRKMSKQEIVQYFLEA